MEMALDFNDFAANIPQEEYAQSSDVFPELFEMFQKALAKVKKFITGIFTLKPNLEK